MPRKPSGTALSSTERQRRYREKLKAEDATHHRVGFVLEDRAVLALKRLAKRSGVTQAEVLERLILDAQARVLNELSPTEQSAYYDSVRA